MQIPLHSDHHVAFNKLKYTIVKTTTVHKSQLT